MSFEVSSNTRSCPKFVILDCRLLRKPCESCHTFATISSIVSFQGDLFAATFLIKNGARVNAATLGAQETPLHLVALYSSKKHSTDVMSEMAQIAEALLQAGANPNMQDSRGR